MNKKKAGIIGAAIIILISMVLELFVFENKYTQYEEQYQLDGSDKRVQITLEQFTSALDEETAEKLRYQEEMNRLYYELLGAEYESTLEQTLTEIDGVTYKTVEQAIVHILFEEEKYIRQMQFTYPVDESKYANYGVEARFYKDGELLHEGLFYDTINSRLDTGYMNVNMLVDEVELETYGDFPFKGDHVSVTFHNYKQFNWYRMLFIAGSGLLILFLLLSDKIYHTHIEWVFAVCALTIGCAMITLIGVNQSGWDEHIHFLKAYEASFGDTIETPEAAMGMRGKYSPGFESLKERQEVTSYLRDNDDMERADISYQSRFIGYGVRSYMPQAIFLKLSRILHLPFDMQYMMGKLGNLLFYIVILMIAMRLSKEYKKYIAILGLMPTPMFLAGEYTYDAFITALLFLGFVLWIQEVQSEEPLVWYRVLLMMICFIAGSWSKQIYIFMMFLLLFFPDKKFPNKIGAWIFRCMTVCASVLILYSIISAPGAAQSLNISTGIDYDFSTAGDVRVQGVSMMGQIQYILQNPLTYTILLLKSVGKTIIPYTFGRYPWTDFAYCGILPAGASVITGAVICMLGLFHEKKEGRKKIGTGWKILISIMFFGIVCVIWTSLYGTYSVVGAEAIEGVQARYYIPLMLPFMYLFANDHPKFCWDNTWYYRILFITVAGLNIYGIYQLILKATLF